MLDIYRMIMNYTYLSGNNNNNNLAIGTSQNSLNLLNKIALVLLLLNLMFVFKVNGSKYKKSSSFGP